MSLQESGDDAVKEACRAGGRLNEEPVEMISSMDEYPDG